MPIVTNSPQTAPIKNAVCVPPMLVHAYSTRTCLFVVINTMNHRPEMGRCVLLLSVSHYCPLMPVVSNLRRTHISIDLFCVLESD